MTTDAELLPIAEGRGKRRAMRRNWISLGGNNVRCVVLDDGHNLKNKLYAYELCSARTATAYDLKRYPYSAGPDRLKTARRIRQLLAGDCCYGFYCKLSGGVKLGRTGDLFCRWSKLESEGGRPLQLVAVWQVADTRSHEGLLHERFCDHRRIGEWFDAAPVCSWLAQTLATRPNWLADQQAPTA